MQNQGARKPTVGQERFCNETVHATLTLYVAVSPKNHDVVALAKGHLQDALTNGMRVSVALNNARYRLDAAIVGHFVEALPTRDWKPVRLAKSHRVVLAGSSTPLPAKGSQPGPGHRAQTARCTCHECSR